MGSAVCIIAILRWLPTERLFGTLPGRTNRPKTNSYVAGLPNMKTLLTTIFIFILVAACNQDEIIKKVPSPTPVYIEVTRVVTATIRPHTPTLIPSPTTPPEPTSTPKPTNTPRTTSTPRPTATHTPPTPTRTMTLEESRCSGKQYPGCPGYTETLIYCDVNRCWCNTSYGKYEICYYDHERPPTRTPRPEPTLAYSIGTIIKHYSAPSFNVHDIQVQFDTHTLRSNGTTYPQDVCYRVKYRDRQGKSQTVTLKFSLFNYNQRDEYIQLYELSSPGTFDDADAQGMEQALTNLKNKKEERRYTCN